MNVTKIFTGLVVTLITLIGTSSFYASINSNAGVSDNKSIAVQEDFKEFKNNINDNNASTKGDLKTKLEILSNPEDDPLSTVSAGLTFVPQILEILFSPITFVHSYIDSVGGQVAQLPYWVTSGLKLLFDLSLLLAIVGMYLRYKP